MAVIARDAVAADQLVYAWPFPIGPEPVEVACGNEEIVVMCPAWAVGDRLGPGRHQWRTPDPQRPTNAYFVLTGPVETSFDMMTVFVIPATQQPVRLRAQGSLLARCIDPAMLVAQFVGLPFDHVNEGVMRSVGGSVERLLARVLVRRVLAAGSPLAVTDPQMLPSIIDELTAYNPTAGAVTGVGFVRFNQLVVTADDGGMGGMMWQQPQPYVTGAHYYPQTGFAAGSQPPPPPGAQMPAEPVSSPDVTSGVISGEIGAGRTKSAPPATVTPDGTILPAGARVLVPSPDGSLHASTIRQHSQGYYEVEIGATGQTVWVPITSVIPER